MYIAYTKRHHSKCALQHEYGVCQVICVCVVQLRSRRDMQQRRRRWWCSRNTLEKKTTYNWQHAHEHAWNLRARHCRLRLHIRCTGALQKSGCRRIYAMFGAMFIRTLYHRHTTRRRMKNIRMLWVIYHRLYTRHVSIEYCICMNVTSICTIHECSIARAVMSKVATCAFRCWKCVCFGIRRMMRVTNRRPPSPPSQQLPPPESAAETAKFNKLYISTAATSHLHKYKCV